MALVNYTEDRIQNNAFSRNKWQKITRFCILFYVFIYYLNCWNPVVFPLKTEQYKRLPIAILMSCFYREVKKCTFFTVFIRWQPIWLGKNIFCCTLAQKRSGKNCTDEKGFDAINASAVLSGSQFGRKYSYLALWQLSFPVCCKQRVSICIEI